jgi:hypothetical protein
MTTRIVAAFALSGALAFVFANAVQAAPSPAEKPKQTKEDVEKAEKAVKEHLAKLNGSNGQVAFINDTALIIKDEQGKEVEFKVKMVKPTIDGKEGAWNAVKKDDKIIVVTDNGSPDGNVTKVEINPTASDAKKAGEGKFVKYNKDEALENTLPDHIFFAVLFRQFPVGRVPPQGLKASNVFVVDKDGKVKVLTNAKELEELFKASVTAKSDNQLKDAARSWLLLAQEFTQDGFYKFSLMDDSTKVSEDNGKKVATGKVVVMQGGNGEITATLTFDDGKLTKAETDVKVKPGPRPICQATKLLDDDPIVRRMAEQDLLIMGRAAKPYLDEQRAKASPELRKAIDQLWERIVKEDR